MGTALYNEPRLRVAHDLCSFNNRRGWRHRPLAKTVPIETSISILTAFAKKLIPVRYGFDL
jgi:hypothetical protein